MQGLPPIALRGMRLEQAVALQEPDRVPFVPTWNNFYQLEYGVSFGESMRDPFTLNAALDHVMDRYEPDLLYMPTVFPSLAMNRAGAKYSRFPGEFHKLGDEVPYQYLDQQFLQDEDFDNFLKDPTWFLFQMLAKKYQNFGGINMFNPNAMNNSCIYSLAPFGLPPVQETLKAMMETGNLVLELLPVIGMFSLSTSFNMDGAKEIRMLGMVSSVGWLIYNIAHLSIGGVACEGMCLVSIILGILRYDLKKKEN